MAARGEEVDGIIQLEIVVAIEVAAHKLMDHIFVLSVKVLELVEGRKLLDLKTIGHNNVSSSSQDTLSLIGCNLGYSCEDMRFLGCTATQVLDRVSHSRSRSVPALCSIQCL